MLPKFHILSGVILTFLVWIFFKVNLLSLSLIFFSSFSFDVDHYLYFVFKKKDLSLKRAYEWCLTVPKEMFPKPIAAFLHSLEFLSVLIFLSFFFNFLWFVVLGFSFHYIFDVGWLYTNKLLSLENVSLFFALRRKKNEQ